MDDLDVAEAAFRFLFETWSIGEWAKRPAYCIELFGKDPPPEFVARFGDVRKPVLADSLCGPRPGGGLRLWVGNVHRFSMTSARAEGGYNNGLMSAQGSSMSLEQRAGRWKVTCMITIWIS